VITRNLEIIISMYLHINLYEGTLKSIKTRLHLIFTCMQINVIFVSMCLCDWCLKDLGFWF